MYHEAALPMGTQGMGAQQKIPSAVPVLQTVIRISTFLHAVWC